VALTHARFARRYARFETAIPNSPPIQPHESDLIATSLLFDEQSTNNQFKRIKGTIASSVAYFQKLDSDSSAWGKAVAAVDASHTHVFSYLWNWHSYEHMESYITREGPDALRKTIFVPDSRSILVANVVSFGLGVSTRVFSTWFAWRQEPDGSFIMAFAPMTDYNQSNRAGGKAAIMRAINDNAAAAEAIRGDVKGFWRIKPLAPEGKRPAFAHTAALFVHTCGWLVVRPFAHSCLWPSVCQVTYVVQAKLGGSLPRSLLNTRIKSTLSSVHDMQDKFARNGKVVDGQVRAALAVVDVPQQDDLTPEQRVLYRQSRELEEDSGPSAPPGAPTPTTKRGTKRGTSRRTARGSVRGSARRTGKAAGASVRRALGMGSDESTWLDLPSPSPLVTMGMQYKPTQPGQEPIVLAEAQAVIDCSMEEAFAWFMMAAGRERTRRHLEYGDLAHVQLNDCTVATIHKTPFRLTDREYVVRSLGAMKGGFNPGYSVALSSEDMGKVDYGQSFRVIRGHLTGLVVIGSSGKKNKNTSRVTFTVQWSGKGNLPPWAMRTEIMRTLSVVDELRTEVQCDDENDAAELAELAKVMTKNRQTYTREESAALNTSIGYFKALGDANFQDLESPDPIVKMEWALDDWESVLRASATVDATVEVCAAFETAKVSERQNEREENSANRPA